MGATRNLDEVSRNKIWEEHVVKENKTLQLNSTFSLSDPRKLNVLPEKPNNFIPEPKPSKEVVAKATQDLADMSSLKDTEKYPNERYALPLTASQEIGFFSSQRLVKNNPQFSYNRDTCDVTKYADNYVNMLGVSPYAKKD